MKVELKYAIREDGDLSVAVGGEVMKLQLCVDNFDIRLKVRIMFFMCLEYIMTFMVKFQFCGLMLCLKKEIYVLVYQIM